MANTSFVRSGLTPQPGSGEGMTTGVIAQLFRTTGAVINPEGDPIMSQAVEAGVTTAVANEYQASNGEFPWEDGKDGNGASYGIIARCLRAADLTAPIDVETSASYTLTNGDTQSDGKTGVTIVHTAGADFAPFFGEHGFVIRTSGSSNPENNRLWPIKRCFDDGGDATLEVLSGATTADAPQVIPDTFWGQPAVTETAVLTVQFGQQTAPGTTIKQDTIVQEFGDIMDEFNVVENATFGNLTTTVTGAFVTQSANWIGGRWRKLTKTNPTLPPAASTVTGPTVNGVVLEGAETMAITVTGDGDVTTFDKFTVAGAKGVYEFLQTATSATLEIAAPSGVFFRPPAPFGGFADDAVITIIHGPSFSPAKNLPTLLSKSRADQEGGVTHIAITTHNSDKSVLMNCDRKGSGVGGFTGGTFVITSGNSGNDNPNCASRRRVIAGTIVPTATVDLELFHDLDDRYEVLTGLGDVEGDAEVFFYLMTWSFALEGVETLPALAGWAANNAVSGSWGFAAGAKDAPVTGSMALTMGESVNFQQELAPMFRRFFIPAI